MIFYSNIIKTPKPSRDGAKKKREREKEKIGKRKKSSTSLLK
jgi:hypothetical protein